MPERILVVEDEDTLRTNLVRYLERQGHEVDGFDTGNAALEAATRTEYAVAVVDVRLPDKDGIRLTAELAERSPETAVLLTTAYGSMETVIEALQVGAQDFLLKPVLLKEVARKVSHACEHRRLLRDNAMLRRQLGARSTPVSIVARSRPMQDIVAFVKQVAISDRTVLIEGESGTGKEMVARLLHDSSPRRDGPFVPVSMTAIAEDQVESCLFGHERGPFPTARDGLFRAASCGTLFLDDVAEIPPAIQAKLLRTIETKEVLPVGSDRPVRFDARIVASASCDLAELVRKKCFRADLYFRLSALCVRVPPLRERPDDIPPLAEMFLRRHTQEHRRSILGFETAAMRCLLSFPWHGNARELSNVVERATLACAGKIITVTDLPHEVAGDDDAGESHQAAMDRFERALIRATLDRADGDRRETARRLGLSLATLYRRLDKLDLKDDEP